jgi:hypothetical protein
MKPQSGNGGKEEIYDCHFAKRLPECVTYDGNIANNSSDVVSGVFSTAIGRRPPCLRERKVAIAKRAAKRATEALAFKKRYYRATLALDRQSGWHNGYSAWNGNALNYQAPTIYWKWVPGSYACPSYDSALGYSCWKIEVITRNGCSGVSVELSEHATDNYSSPSLGTAYGTGGSVSREVPTVIEADADNTSAKWAFVESLTCD